MFHFESGLRDVLYKALAFIEEVGDRFPRHAGAEEQGGGMEGGILSTCELTGLNHRDAGKPCNTVTVGLEINMYTALLGLLGL